MKTSIAVAEGDGIGPEIMQATLHVLHTAGADLDIHHVELGERVFRKGILTGIDPSAWNTLRNTRALLKAPLITSQGQDVQRINAIIRTALGLYAHVRPCVSYHPFVFTQHPEMDVVIIRETEEDLYTGIEYCQTPHVAHALKIISRTGSERIIRYAFEYARQQGRKKVTTFAKDNVLPLSDGLFRQVFDEIASQYPDILNEFWAVDTGAAKLADAPEDFDVIVLSNLYGDILSNVAAGIAGPIGLIGSAHIGEHHAMFEALHGTDPHHAGQNVANPSGLLLAALQMLVHIGQVPVAERIHNAWLRTLEEGIHTDDIYREGVSKQRVGTQEFAEAVIQHLGDKPSILTPIVLRSAKRTLATTNKETTVVRHLVGIDVTIYHRGPLPLFLPQISHIAIGSLRLRMISNRGTRVWPQGKPEITCIEQWLCRFTTDEGHTTSQHDVIQVLHAFDHVNIEVLKADFLYTISGKLGYNIPPST
jgi:isocitrate dehydrogenase